MTAFPIRNTPPKKSLRLVPEPHEWLMRRAILRLLEPGGMQGKPPQTNYWDRIAPKKRFTHPLRLEWLQQHLRPQACILDHGCGYGRLFDQLLGAGYGNVVGTDFSEKMLMRSRSSFSELRLVRNDGQALPFRDRSFDAVLLFTVLTCIPGDDDQRRLLAEVERILRPDGIVYISDLLINSDLRNVERYEHDADRFGVYGIFELPEGVIVRHHRQEWIEQLVGSFERLALEQFTVTTMNGNESAAFQCLGRASR